MAAQPRILLPVKSIGPTCGWLAIAFAAASPIWITPDENARMAIHQKTIAAGHCGELHFEHAANQIMQAFLKFCIIHRTL